MLTLLVVLTLLEVLTLLVLNRQTFGVVQLAVENKGVKLGTGSWELVMKSVALRSAWACWLVADRA